MKNTDKDQLSSSMNESDNSGQQIIGRKPLNESPCSSTFLAADKRCKICAKLPYHARPGLVAALAMHSRECFDIDFGLFEVVDHTLQPHEDFKKDRKLAERTADAAQRNVKSFQKHLQINERTSGVTKNQRVVAVSKAVAFKLRCFPAS